MKVYTPTLAKAIPLLWEAKPDFGNPTRPAGDNYTVCGYISNSKKRTSHLLKNCAAISKSIGQPWHYPYDGTITVCDLLDVDQHRKLWDILRRCLTALGFSAGYHREVTRQNKINYHFVFRHVNEDMLADKAKKLKAELRKLTTVKLNMQFKPIKAFKNCVDQCNYITKIKRPGTKGKYKPTESDDVDSATKTQQHTDDIYLSKRVLFKKLPKGQRMPRFGDFGDFWHQSPTVSQTQYRAKKKAVQAKRQAHPDIESASRELAEITQLPAQDIEHNLHAEQANASPQELPRILAQNRQLAEQHHGGKDGYADYLRARAEQAAIDAQRRQLRPQNPRTTRATTTKTPFDPARCNSFTASF